MVAKIKQLAILYEFVLLASQIIKSLNLQNPEKAQLKLALITTLNKQKNGRID